MRSRTAFIVFLLIATPSLARQELLEWTHPDPQGVDGYKVYAGQSPGVYAPPIDVGPRTPDANGVMSYDLQVADTATVYVAVSAYAGTDESVLSNERVRMAQAPPPPPPSASTWFRVIDPPTDTVLGSIEDGDTIDTDLTPSIAIEIVTDGNEGSVFPRFDGTDKYCQTRMAGFEFYGFPYRAGRSTPRFGAWSPVPGTHVLKADVYPTFDCSGPPSDQASVTFVVVDDAPPPPPPVLGEPAPAGAVLGAPAWTVDSPAVFEVGAHPDAAAYVWTQVDHVSGARGPETVTQTPTLAIACISKRTVVEVAAENDAGNRGPVSASKVVHCRDENAVGIDVDGDGIVGVQDVGRMLRAFNAGARSH